MIELQPGDPEAVIASGLALGDAEELCASKIEAQRQAAPAPPADSEPAPAAPKIRKHGERQLAFSF